VTDELWAVVAPLLPARRAQPKGGRPWVDDRATLNGVLYVLRGGIPWRLLPTALGYGSGVTCWRRLRDWQRRGVWRRLHQVMLERLAAADRIDWSRAALDSRSLPAKGGLGRRPQPDRQGQARVEAPRPRRPAGHPARRRGDRGERPRQPGARAAARRHRAGAHRPAGRPRRRPAKLHADKGYDYRRCRDECVRRGIKHRIARQRVEPKARLGRHRWIVERTLAWLARYRRLTIRYERLAELHAAFLDLACARVC
jgi:transposase